MDMDMDMDPNMGMDMGKNMSMHMSMTFHFGYDEKVLFDQWSFNSVGGLVASMAGIVILAMVYEGLKYFREYLFSKGNATLHQTSRALSDRGLQNDGVLSMMLSKMHCLQTLLHLIQLTLSYLLMLIFMTYNVWLCLAVVLGAGIGYFLVGWKRTSAVDNTEHCQ